MKKKNIKFFNGQIYENANMLMYFQLKSTNQIKLMVFSVTFNNISAI